MLRRLAATLAFPLALAANPAPAPATSPGGPAVPARAHWTVRTDPQTQALIDRGVAMLYAFDTGEARVAFSAAIARDPNLVLAYWGLAEADTIDINVVSSPEGEVRGAAAVAQARAHLRDASPEERVLLDAIGQRFAPGTLRQKLDRYASALSEYTKAHRDDANVLTIAAFAIFEATPTFTDANNALNTKAREILADLDRALVLDPQHLGAHHLRIHLLEEADRAQEAVPDAEALASYDYAPGMSHLAHMSAHVWVRVGDYARAVSDNERALANDRAWFALGDGPGQQYMKRYHDHVVDFVLYGLSTLGRDDDARSFVQGEDAFSRAHLLVRLHDDAGALEAAGPDAHFVRATAAARSGDAARAQAERAQVRGEDAGARTALIDAALARHAGDLAAAVAAYQRAYDATKTAFPGDPKDEWYIPIGEGYGALLLAAGKPADAASVFTAELARFPRDPRLEWGLAEALKAQGKDDSAARAAYRAAWKGTHELSLADLG
jgi:tetratricopeptide (TPR) repeat protein